MNTRNTLLVVGLVVCALIFSINTASAHGPRGYGGHGGYVKMYPGGGYGGHGGHGYRGHYGGRGNDGYGGYGRDCHRPPVVVVPVTPCYGPHYHVGPYRW